MLGTKIRNRTGLSCSCSLLCFSVFFLCFLLFLVAWRLDFSSFFSFTLRSLSLWENDWKCFNGCQFLRFDSFQMEPFVFLDCGCVSMMILSQILFDYWLFWVPFLSSLRIAPALKPIPKKRVKRGARVLRVIPWGSFKEQENRTSNIRNLENLSCGLNAPWLAYGGGFCNLIPHASNFKKIISLLHATN